MDNENKLYYGFLFLMAILIGFWIFSKRDTDCYLIPSQKEISVANVPWSETSGDTINIVWDNLAGEPLRIPFFKQYVYSDKIEIRKAVIK